LLRFAGGDEAKNKQGRQAALPAFFAFLASLALLRFAGGEGVLRFLLFCFIACLPCFARLRSKAFCYARISACFVLSPCEASRDASFCFFATLAFGVLATYLGSA
jgi:hypothetical protein